MNITSNAQQLAKRWEQRSKQLAVVMAKATKQATDIYYAESRKQITALIYDKPIPSKADMQGERRKRTEGKGKTFRSGKFGKRENGKFVAASRQKTEGKQKAWRRSGNLRRMEKRKVVSPYLGIVYNDASTKQRDAALGLKSKGAARNYARPRHDMKHTRYPAPWRDVARTNALPKVRMVYRAAMRDAIRKGII